VIATFDFWLSWLLELRVGDLRMKAS